jgi:hypothetical protein
MVNFLAPIEPVAPDFSSGLKAKAGKWNPEKAQANRF